MNFFSEESQIAKQCLSTIVKIAEQNADCIYPRKGDDDSWCRMCDRLLDSSSIGLTDLFFESKVEFNDPRYQEVSNFLERVERFRHPTLRQQISKKGRLLIVAELKAALESYKLLTAKQIELV
jgi:hypothetical protein